jgi:outer membrane murein-binding lipoprotein Lpp
MDRRTDTGSGMSGTGSNSPVPGGCTTCSVSQLLSQVEQLTRKVEQLTRRVSQLEQDRELQKQLFAMMAQGYAAANTSADDNTPTINTTKTKETMATPTPTEPPLMELPDIFVEPLRQDVRRANSLVRLLRGDILRLIKDRQQKTLQWYHVFKTFMDCQLIFDDTSPTAFGKAIKTIVGGVPKADTIRRQASKDDIGRDKAMKDFHSWPDNCRDKSLCLTVEQLLKENGIQTNRSK